MFRDIITDVEEIAEPMLIAVACIDKLIRIISMKEKKIMGILQGHIKGVRQLHYSPFQDGYMVSVGFEAFCNVWTFEGGMGSIQSTLSLNKTNTVNKSNLQGKFNNYKHVIRLAKFIMNSPFCVEIDEKHILKLFNF